jgi:hypothetical protein
MPVVISEVAQLRHITCAPGVAASYFTCWALVAHALVRGDTRCLALLVSLAGGYLSYVHPRCIALPGYRITGCALRVVDAVFHQLPLLAVLWCVGGRRPPSRADLVGTLALLSVYVVAHPEWPERYGMRGHDVLVLTLAVPLAVLLLL